MPTTNVNRTLTGLLYCRFTKTELILIARPDNLFLVVILPLLGTGYVLSLKKEKYIHLTFIVGLKIIVDLIAIDIKIPRSSLLLLVYLISKR